MPKIKNLLLALLLIAGAGYGGLKAYIYYKFKNNIDDVVAMAQPFARIDYGGLGSSLDGTLTVKDITIAPLIFDDEIRVRSLEIQGPGLGFLLSGTKQFKRGEIPERLRFALKGAQLNVNRGLFNAIRGAQKSDWALMTGQESTDCGVGQIFGPWNAGELGYDRLVIDSDIGFRFDKAIRELRMEMHYAAHGIESTSMQMALSEMTPSAAILAGVQPQLNDLTITYRIDPSYASKAIDYCAQANKKTVDEFIQWVVSKDNKYYAKTLGIVPGPGIRGGLERFLKNPSEIHISIQPPTSFDMAGLQFYKPEDIIDLLGLQLFVNGQPVSDLSFQLANASHLKQKKRKPAAKTLESAKASRLPPEVRRRAVARARIGASSTQQAEYRRVSTSALKNHIGKRVRLQTTSGRRRDGWLMQVRNGEAVIEPDRYGGSVSIPVPLSNITQAEVLVAATPE